MYRYINFPSAKINFVGEFEYAFQNLFTIIITVYSTLKEPEDNPKLDER